MKNRPVNPKAEARNPAKAGLDVRAMVRDRRSGRGKSTGSPPPPPDHVSSDEQALLRHALDERRTGEAIIARADAAIESAMRHLIRKYGLAGRDSIDPETGLIARALGAPSER